MRLLPLCLLVLFAISISQAESGLLPQGTEAKKFLNLDAKGQYVGLRDFIGPQASKSPKLVVVSFWSVTCIPCRKEMPLLEAWAAKHASDVELLLINVDKKDSGDVVRKFVELNQVKGRVLFDFYQATAKAFGVCEGNSCSLPALYVVNAKGVIDLSLSGFDESRNLEATLDGLLLKPATESATKGSDVTAGGLTADTKVMVLHQILAGLDQVALAKKYKVSKEQVQKILDETEAAAIKQWAPSVR